MTVGAPGQVNPGAGETCVNAALTCALRPHCADFNPGDPGMRASMSPLLVAACEGDVCTVQHLLCEAKGKSERALFEALELRDTLLRFTPLLACICGARVAGKASHAEVLRLLLDAGARAGCRDVAGYTPVHHCSFRLTSDTAVRLLPMIVAAGGDVNAKNRAGRTAIMEPTMGNRNDAVEALMKLGADPRIQDPAGYSAMSVCSLNPQASKLFNAYVKAQLALKTMPSLVDAASGGLTGRRVTLVGLQSRPELNGLSCFAGQFDKEAGRYEMTLEADGGEPGEKMRVKAGNLKHDISLEAACGCCGAPGARKRCGACLVVFYCHAACSAQHWPVHRPLCAAAREQNVAIVPKQSAEEPYNVSLSLNPGTGTKAHDNPGKPPAVGKSFIVKVQVAVDQVHAGMSAIARDAVTALTGDPTYLGQRDVKLPLFIYNETRSVVRHMPVNAVGYEGLVRAVDAHGLTRMKAYFKATIVADGSLRIAYGEVLPLQPW